MRLAFILAPLLLPDAEAALLAHVTTTEGVITTELEYATAPLAVANFITLSQGIRNRIDPLTGAVTNTPLYVGETFFRTGDNSFSKFAQTGSGSGSNSGSTGFTFRDEFDPAIRHTGYTLSSANSGPNTNGGQVFFTGNISIPAYDDLHTILGRVTDPASRAVVDAVIAAGDNGSSITAVTIERTDPGAVAFDEHAQGLPTVSEVDGAFRVEPGPVAHFDPAAALPSGTLLAVRRSVNLNQWGALAGVFSGYDNAPVLSAKVDEGAGPRAFYRFATVDYAGALAPGTLGNRVLFIDAPDQGWTFTFTFDASGTGGTCSYFDGAATSVSNIVYVYYATHGFSSTLLVDTDGLPLLRFGLGHDGSNATHVDGRHTWAVYSGGWIPYGGGTFTLTR
ncbi:hypothetical protein Hhel01_00053 [Haloferula helveola]